MLRETKLLDEFAPELSAMHGVMQNEFHLYDVWEHSLRALINLPANSRLNLKLAALFHDIGKPQTKTIDEDGRIHFYEHQKLSEAISRKIMQRLKFSNADIDEVSFLVGMHMRVGQYNEQWTNAAIRRLVREFFSNPIFIKVWKICPESIGFQNLASSRDIISMNIKDHFRFK